jgi:hypothetical protein
MSLNTCVLWQKNFRGNYPDFDDIKGKIFRNPFASNLSVEKLPWTIQDEFQMNGIYSFDKDAFGEKNLTVFW